MDYNEYVSKILDGVWYENYKGFKLRDFNDENEEEHYDNLCAENNIAECLMTHKKDEWDKIRGGKYTRFDIEYKYPDNNYIKDCEDLESYNQHKEIFYNNINLFDEI